MGNVVDGAAGNIPEFRYAPAPRDALHHLVKRAVAPGKDERVVFFRCFRGGARHIAPPLGGIGVHRAVFSLQRADDPPELFRDFSPAADRIV